MHWQCVQQSLAELRDSASFVDGRLEATMNLLCATGAHPLPPETVDLLVPSFNFLDASLAHTTLQVLAKCAVQDAAALWQEDVVHQFGARDPEVVKKAASLFVEHHVRGALMVPGVLLSKGVVRTVMEALRCHRLHSVRGARARTSARLTRRRGCLS